ncbi:hypothetical protein A9Q78_09365 [Methylophaga sp. 41_12_T18]|nr:hypothetical protein A9Q78_09365 [Methylophaga sp. 41_12_T18]
MPAKFRLSTFILLFVIMCLQPALAKDYSSQNSATHVIELYTSEGCSSCPPADQWLSQLKSKPGLFTKFIPMAFHVDYWNQLGWTDRFSNKANSQRQYQHQQQGHISQVYTPGVMLNNKEWRGWYSNRQDWSKAQEKVGILKVNHNTDTNQLNISYTADSKIIEPSMQLNIAILGIGLSNEIKDGENRGQVLKHDFVVLNHQQQTVSMKSELNQQNWQLELPTIPTSGQQQSALVVWLSIIDSQAIIQATGGYL